MTWADNRNTELEVGQTVAYNLSGQIAKGRIIGLKLGGNYYQKPNHWNPDGHPTVEIELLHDAAGKQAGWVSKVQNEKNVLVIVEVDA